MAQTPPTRFEKICVLGGDLKGKKKIFVDTSLHVGAVLAQQKVQLIYGGGNLGLMGAVVAGAHAAGSQILGIVPKPFTPSCGPTLGTEIQVWSPQERISLMCHSAGAFIALPGGLNVLEEVSCVASWSSMSSLRTPIGLLNINGYFNSLLSFLDNAVESGFMSTESRKIILSDVTIEGLFKKLQEYKGYPSTVIPQASGSGSTKRKIDEQEVDSSLRL